ncbi:MAG TPA: hypothetical protein ENK11_08255 [Phycisphaerales bacterium]|nr:hypothetical protein [Phycisphaerales bacterium]
MEKADRTVAHAAARVAALALLVALTGCRGGQKIDYARPEPVGLTDGGVIDIQVYRDVTTLEFTNTTARRFEDATVWLNQRFSRPVGTIEPGQSVTLPLREFVDEFGDTFRAGGFFATRDPDPVVLAQLESGGVMYGLLLGGNRIK